MSQDTPHPERRKQRNRRVRRNGGHSPSGRRRTDQNPHTTFTKKFLVIVVAVINAIYLASEAILSVINSSC